MLEMDICGLLQEHILSWAQNSWFVILHMSLVDDFIVYELGLEAPVLGSQEGISQEELSLTSVTVMKWILCFAILSTVPCVHGGEKLRVTSFLPAHTPNAAELGFLRTLWVLEAEKTAGASWVALPHQLNGGALLYLLWPARRGGKWCFEKKMRALLKMNYVYRLEKDSFHIISLK